MYQNYNANPIARRSDDCTVRAISKLLDKSWEDVYCSLCDYGLMNFDMPSSNYVWGQYLHDRGYSRHIMPDTCPHCYTVRRFAEEHPHGRYLLALNGHVVCCINGTYFDTWDSGDEIVLYYWRK
ncbi:MAG: hypothetical protein KBT03_04685 [Bacteroidales bacterium]|nr:hypothetical protein [Candidatus Scybalousia scybalohippi]